MGISVGETIGDYQVIGELGSGGMGSVFKVRHLISDRIEAMKVLLPDFEQNPELTERFLREIRVHASLSHPAIATLHTALRHNRQLLMVMEYVPGESLNLLLRRKRILLPEAVDITIQLLSALDYAHSLGIIHRDIKPANIMSLQGSRIKLLDFGIARPSLEPGLTHTGSAVGSLSYMSPEQVRGLKVDHRTDLYATGVTLYEIATGVRPFTNEDPYAVMKAKVEELPPSARSLNRTIPPEFDRIIGRALVRDPAGRFQTAREFSLALEDSRATLTNGPAAANDTLALPLADAKVATPGSPTPALVLFEPESIERLTHTLADLLGPVAKLLVARTARKAASWDELYAVLAAEIPAGRDRDKFLASRRSIVLGRK